MSRKVCMPKQSKRKVSSGRDKDAGFLSSAGKVLDALELLGKVSSLSVTELAKAKNIPVSTAYRSLATLTRRGYAVKRSGDRRYYPGPKLSK